MCILFIVYSMSSFSGAIIHLKGKVSGFNVQEGYLEIKSKGNKVRLKMSEHEINYYKSKRDVHISLPSNRVMLRSKGRFVSF